MCASSRKGGGYMKTRGLTVCRNCSRFVGIWEIGRDYIHCDVVVVVVVVVV